MVEGGSKLVFLKFSGELSLQRLECMRLPKGMGVRGWAKWNQYDFDVQRGFCVPWMITNTKHCKYVLARRCCWKCFACSFFHDFFHFSGVKSALNLSAFGVLYSPSLPSLSYNLLTKYQTGVNTFKSLSQESILAINADWQNTLMGYFGSEKLSPKSGSRKEEVKLNAH